jgi:hypothetical protein
MKIHISSLRRKVFTVMEIYFVHSETKPGIRYQVNFEDGTCTCVDFKNREKPASISLRL